LEKKWKAVLALPSMKCDCDKVANETLDYLAETKNSDDTKQQLTDIMMGQNFQDLAGKVIERVTGLVQELE
jgi:chemotaxis regulatin CheY-phosphate phosphatase CheZ